MFTWYCFNDGYAAYTLLNGLMSFFGSSTWTSMYMVGIAMAVITAALATRKIDPFQYVMGLLGPFLFYLAFFGTNATVNIVDEYASENYSVSHVPTGVGLTLDIVSTLQRVIMNLVETHIEPPGTTSFRNFDFFGEISGINNMLTGKIVSDLPLLNTISQYYDDCVMHGYIDGLTSDSQVLSSNDLLEAMQTPYTIYFTRVYNSDGTTGIYSCATAYNDFIKPQVGALSLSNAPGSPLASMSGIFGHKGSNLPAVRAALGNLGDVYFQGNQDTADQMFRNVIMMTALRTGLAQSDPASLGMFTEAEVRQKSGVAAAAFTYLKSLPMLRSMFMMVLVALLPAVGALFMLQNGRPFVQWAGALFWVSLFLPMQAVIHAVYSSAFLNEMRNLTEAAGGLTWNSQLKILGLCTDTGVIAGTLAFMIPSLAGLVVAWAMPRSSTGIAQLLAGSRAMERTAMSGGMGSLDSAQRRAADIERQKLARDFLEAGSNFTASTRAGNEMFDAMTGKALNRAFGQDPRSANSSGQAIESRSGGYTVSAGTAGSRAQELGHMATEKFSQQFGAAQSAAHSINRMTNRQMADQYAHQLMSSIDAKRAVAESSDARKMYETIKNSDYGKSMSEEHMTQAAVAASLGFKVKGTGGGVDFSQGMSAKDAATFREAVGMAQRSSAGVAMQKRHEQSVNAQESDGHSTTSGVGASQEERAQKSLQAVEQYGREYAKIHQAADKQTSLVSSKGDSSVSISQIFGRMASQEPVLLKSLGMMRSDNGRGGLIFEELHKSLGQTNDSKQHGVAAMFDVMQAPDDKKRAEMMGAVATIARMGDTAETVVLQAQRAQAIFEANAGYAEAVGTGKADLNAKMGEGFEAKATNKLDSAFADTERHFQRLDQATNAMIGGAGPSAEAKGNLDGAAGALQGVRGQVNAAVPAGGGLFNQGSQELERRYDANSADFSKNAQAKVEDHALINVQDSPVGFLAKGAVAVAGGAVDLAKGAGEAVGAALGGPLATGTGTGSGVVRQGLEIGPPPAEPSHMSEPPSAPPSAPSGAGAHPAMPVALTPTNNGPRSRKERGPGEGESLGDAFNSSNQERSMKGYKENP